MGVGCLRGSDDGALGVGVEGTRGVEGQAYCCVNIHLNGRLGGWMGGS